MPKRVDPNADLSDMGQGLGIMVSKWINHLFRNEPKSALSGAAIPTLSISNYHTSPR